MEKTYDTGCYFLNSLLLFQQYSESKILCLASRVSGVVTSGTLAGKGEWQADAIREIAANWSGIHSTTTASSASGAGRLTSHFRECGNSAGEGYAQPSRLPPLSFRLPPKRPVNVSLPVYVSGLSA